MVWIRAASASVAFGNGEDELEGRSVRRRSRIAAVSSGSGMVVELVSQVQMVVKSEASRVVIVAYKACIGRLCGISLSGDDDVGDR